MKNFSAKTKGNSYLNSNNERPRKKYLIWIVGAIFVLVFAKDVVSSITSSFTTTLFTVRHYIMTSSGTIPVFIRSRVELLNHIQELEQQIASQKGIESTLGFVTEENEELRGLLGGTTTPRIVAGVIARPPYTPYDTVVIDRGSEEGIVLNAPVYQVGGNALGYVQSVFPHSAFITLFSSPGVETTVYVFGPDIFTTAHGEGGGVVRLSVPQGIAILKGMPVVLPSLESGTLGLIGEIQSISTEPEQHAYVTFHTPLQSIRLVSVGRYPVEQTSYKQATENIESIENSLFTIEVPEELRIYTTSDPSLSSTTSSTTATTSTLLSP